MKRFKIILDIKCTDEFFEKEVKELRDKILGGAFNAEYKREYEGIKSVQSVFEEIK